MNHVLDFLLGVYVISIVFTALICTFAYDHIQASNRERILKKYKGASENGVNTSALIGCLISIVTPVFNTYMVYHVILTAIRSTRK